MSFINFENSNVRQENRKEIKKAREIILKKAEEDFIKIKSLEERRKQRGDDKWILPELDERIKESGGCVKHKKNKKEKKRKKKKKRKKASSSEVKQPTLNAHRKAKTDTMKIENKPNYSTPSTQKDSEEDSSEVEWIEKEKGEEKKITEDPQKQTLQRDDWMNFFDTVSTTSSSRENKKNLAVNKNDEKNILDKLGQSNRELNPYWKDGGTGLPKLENASGKVGTSVGDGGVAWLQKALERVRQQAKEEGRTEEDVARDRWGSLERLENMLADAKDKWANSDRNHSRVKRWHSGQRKNIHFQKPGEKSSRESNNFKRSPETEFKVQFSSSSNRRLADDRSGSRIPNWKKKREPEKSADKMMSPIEKKQNISQKKHQSSSSSSDSESNIKVTESELLTDDQMNELGAKIVKAEILGNDVLAKELRLKLEAARVAKARNETKTNEDKEEVIFLTKTDVHGNIRPAHLLSSNMNSQRKMEQRSKPRRDVKSQFLENTHSLQEMFELEKFRSSGDGEAEFVRLAGKVGVGNEYDVSDDFAEKASHSGRSNAEREHGRVIAENRRINKVLDGCKWCLGGSELPKHLLVSLGEKVFLCMPPYHSLTEGHCLLVPSQHVPCATQLDEDVWEEMQRFKKTLVAMFKTKNQDVVFFETAVFLRKLPHMVLECVPLEKEMGDVAPVYFKKAILECETEWATNKKVVDLGGKDIRRCVPKELPYFCINFGSEGGFAHVIEDEKNFPRNFAQEVIGGMLDLDHFLWRKQRRENFEDQRKKVLQFSHWWKPYDFTHPKNRRLSSSSESD